MDQLLIEQAKAKLAEAQTESNAVRSRLLELKQSITPITDALSQTREVAEIEKLTAKQAASQTLLTKLESDARTAERQVEQAAEELRSLELERRQLLHLRQERERKVLILKQRHQQLLSEVQSLEHQRGQAQDRLDQVDARLQQLGANQEDGHQLTAA